MQIEKNTFFYNSCIPDKASSCCDSDNPTKCLKDYGANHNLKIKSIWGQSENAVKTQVWIAVSVYVLVAIAKKRFMLKQSLYEILQILSISIFERMPINQLFQQTQLQYFKEQKDNQLNIFYL